MAFAFALIILLGTAALQLLVIAAQMMRPNGDGSFYEVFWPSVIGVPLSALVAASHWFNLSW